MDSLVECLRAHALKTYEDKTRLLLTGKYDCSMLETELIKGIGVTAGNCDSVLQSMRVNSHRIQEEYIEISEMIDDIETAIKKALDGKSDMNKYAVMKEFLIQVMEKLKEFGKN